MSRLQSVLRNAKFGTLYFLINLVLSFVVRKYFIDKLGSELVGLTGTVNNIIGFLNLAELGFGTAIIFALYEPLKDRDHKRVSEVLSILKYYYFKIGKVVIVLGGIVLIFSKYLFAKSSLSSFEIVVTYSVYWLASVINYFFNFKSFYFIANQEVYKITRLQSLTQAIKLLFQILPLFFLSGRNSILLFLSIEIGATILYSYLLNAQFGKVGHFKVVKLKAGDSIFEKYKFIKHKVSQLVSHMSAGFILNQTDNLLIFYFTNLSVVAIYSNYLLITQKALSFINQLFSGISSSVGNLVAEKNCKREVEVYFQILVVRFYLGAVLCTGAYFVLDQLIVRWIGEGFLMSEISKCILLANIFIGIFRTVTEAFLTAKGLFADTWAAWVEAGLNIILSIILGYKFGLSGVLAGTLISLLIIVCIWKPYYLFSKGFNMGVRVYWVEFLKMLMAVVVPIGLFAVFGFYSTIANALPSVNTISFILYLIGISIILFIAYGAGLIISSKYSRQIRVSVAKVYAVILNK